jgi:hypothetical protein
MNYIAKLFMNSLYGRFGMEDNFNDIIIVNNSLLNKMTEDNKILIKDIINIDKDNFLVQVQQNEEGKIISSINNLNENHNINIAIASFVTSYARIFMSQFKNNNDIKLFYTDTDSAVVNKPLPDNLVDNKKLGKMKLEYISTKGIFLAPKLYCLLTDNGIINKTRGLTLDIHLNFQDFENLLYKDSEIIKKQNKWFKSIYSGTIKIDEYKNIIASIQYRYGLFDSIREVDVKNNNNIFRDGKDLDIILVIRDPQNELESTPITNRISFNWNSKYNKAQYLELIQIPDHAFFTKSYTDELFFDTQTNLSFKIFIFESTQWKVLVNNFKNIGIGLSGGLTTKRHVLSHVQMKLTRFLLILEGWTKSYENTTTSYKIHNIMHSNNIIDNFSKNKIIWEIRQKFKTLINYDNVALDKRLFLLNRIDSNNIKNIYDYLDDIENDPQKSIEALYYEILNQNFNSSEYSDIINPNFVKSLEKFDNIYHFKDNINNKATIKPIKNGLLNIDTCVLISVMDIETISFNNKQIPICISTSYNSNCNKLFLIDYNLLQTDCNKAVNNLWEDYFHFITKN